MRDGPFARSTAWICVALVALTVLASSDEVRDGAPQAAPAVLQQLNQSEPRPVEPVGLLESTPTSEAGADNVSVARPDSKDASVRDLDQTRTPTAGHGAAAQEYEVEDSASVAAEAVTLLSDKMLPPADPPHGSTSDVADELFYDAPTESSTLGDDQFALPEDYIAQSSLSAISFWLQYQATEQDKKHLERAASAQHDIDVASQQLRAELLRVRSEFQYRLQQLYEKRNSVLDRRPGFWSRQLQHGAPHFWQQQYWSPYERQLDSISDSAAAPFVFVPVHDEVFLMQSLVSMRCAHHAAPTDEPGNEFVSVTFTFDDAPMHIFPFAEKSMHRRVPLSLANRFSSTSWQHNGDNLVVEAETGGNGSRRREFGSGTELTLRREFVADQLRTAALRTSERGTVAWTPVAAPTSFFALFSPQSYYDTIGEDEWLLLQKRLGLLVADVCELSAQQLDVLEASTGTPIHNYDDSHGSAEWEASIAAEAAALDALKALDL